MKADVVVIRDGGYAVRVRSDHEDGAYEIALLGCATAVDSESLLVAVNKYVRGVGAGFAGPNTAKPENNPLCEGCAHLPTCRGVKAGDPMRDTDNERYACHE